MGRIDTVRALARRAAVSSSTSRGMAVLFAIGLLLRLVLAARSQGFPFDISSFSAWAETLAATGPGRFYEEVSFADYPPGYLYVLYVIGKLGPGVPSAFVLKLPAIAADLGMAWFVVLLARRLTPVSLRRRWPVSGPAAAAVLLNPAVFFVSAVWGQVDSILAVLVLASFVMLGTGSPSLRRDAGGMALLALGVATKPQAAFVLPVVVLVLVWRHVRCPVVERAQGQRAAAYFGGARRIALLGIVPVAVGLVVLAPFGLGLRLTGGFGFDITAPVEFYLGAASTYEVTSVFAFNFWGVAGFWKPDSGADAVTVLGIPAVLIGVGLFVAFAGAVLARAWAALRDGEHQGRVLVFGGTAFTLVAFASLTRIHDRYLFMGLAALAVFAGFRQLRWALVGLSVLYVLNVYFPYVYYLEFEQLPAPRIPFYDALYGTALSSPQLKLVSLVTAAACLLVAWRGWAWLAAAGVDDIAEVPAAAPSDSVTLAPVDEAGTDAAERVRRRPFALHLHPIARRGALVGGVVFVIALATRLPGLASPAGMYFDEVYHARTAGEYLQGREVYEWTHPPLAKELMAASVSLFAGYGVHGRAEAPAGLLGSAAATAGADVVWASPAGTSVGALRRGTFGRGCGIEPAGTPTLVGVLPSTIAATSAAVYVGGIGEEGPTVSHVAGSDEVWRAALPSEPTALAVAGSTVFALTVDGSLHLIDADGVSRPIATGVGGIASDGTGTVWAAFAAERRVAAFSAEGTSSTSIPVDGEPGPIVVPADTQRVLVGLDDEVASLDTQAATTAGVIDGGASRFATLEGSGLVWVLDDARARIVEPRGVSVLGSVALPDQPRTVLSDPTHRRVVVVSDDGLACVGGDAAFAWRLGSAIAGSAIAALVALLALRLFGSVLAAGLAAGFVVVDGLAFVLARIAMNDSYVTAFVLAAWLGTLSVLYHLGAQERARNRRLALAWLAAAGVAAGLALGSKWVGVYAMAGIGTLLAWDAWRRGRDGLLGIASTPVRSLAIVGAVIGLLPLAIYVSTYAPYFGLGHGLGDFLNLQRGMYDYHSGLDATHPYGSPWYGWPFGRRAVWLYLGEAAGSRAEIWTVANPIVAVGGLGGLGAMIVTARKRRMAAPVVVLLAAAVQFVPWIFVGRVTFLYHYLPVVPFLAIALGWWLAGGMSAVRDGWPSRTALVVAGGATVAFVALLPILDGWFVSPGYIEGVKDWLGWMF